MLHNGGLVLVSHDFRLISQVANEIWICENQTVTPWKGTIREYKEILKNNVLGADGKKKDMAAASADHYNKPVEVPAAIKKAPVKKMQVLSISSNKKADSPKQSPAANQDMSDRFAKLPNGKNSPSPPKKTGGKFVPPGKRSQEVNNNAASDDWW